MLGGVAVTGLIPRPERTSSVMCVLPRADEPRPRAARHHFGIALGHPARRSAEPASVPVPAVSKVLPAHRHPVERPAPEPRLRPARRGGRLGPCAPGVVRA